MLEQKGSGFFVITEEGLNSLAEQEEQEKEVERLKQENADQAFEMMMLEAKSTQQEKDMADMQFTLMMGGIL